MNKGWSSHHLMIVKSVNKKSKLKDLGSLKKCSKDIMLRGQDRNLRGWLLELQKLLKLISNLIRSYSKLLKVREFMVGYISTPNKAKGTYRRLKSWAIDDFDKALLI